MTANVGRASSAHQRALEPCPGAEKIENKNLQSDTGIIFQPNTKKHLCRWFASSIVQPIKHGNGASLMEKNVFSFFMQSSSMPLALLLSSIASNYADFASSRARALSSIFFASAKAIYPSNNPHRCYTTTTRVRKRLCS